MGHAIATLPDSTAEAATPAANLLPLFSSLVRHWRTAPAPSEYAEARPCLIVLPLRRACVHVSTWACTSVQIAHVSDVVVQRCIRSNCAVLSNCWSSLAHARTHTHTHTRTQKKNIYIYIYIAETPAQGRARAPGLALQFHARCLRGLRHAHYNERFLSPPPPPSPSQTPAAAPWEMCNAWLVADSSWPRRGWSAHRICVTGIAARRSVRHARGAPSITPRPHPLLCGPPEWRHRCVRNTRAPAPL